MMHYDNTIVTLKGLRYGQFFRELDHRRSGATSTARVVMPFDTEYGIQFKFQDGIRRRLELRIDGTLVTDNLILSDSVLLERFADSDRRFKFVRADHPDVADPTSPDNGYIEIKLWKEYQPPVQYVRPDPFPDRWQNPWQQPGAWGGASDPTPKSPIIRSMSFGGGTTSMNCSAQSSPVRGMGYGDAISPLAGATVEGGHSSQTFGTTEWRGDCGSPQVYRFKVEGKDAVAPRLHYCPGCGRKQKTVQNYCPDCGAKQ